MSNVMQIQNVSVMLAFGSPLVIFGNQNALGALKNNVLLCFYELNN